MQPDSSLSQQQSSPPPDTRKPGKFNIQVVFLVILILAAAGLGYWTMQLNNTLKAAQGDLATLQGQHKDLTSQKNTLSSELDQTTTELEGTNGEISTTKDSLAATKSELAKSNNDLSALKKKMDKARSYIDVIRYIYEDEDATFFGAFILVTAIKDAKLDDLFADWMANPTYDLWVQWTGYAMNTAVETLTK